MQGKPSKEQRVPFKVKVAHQNLSQTDIDGTATFNSRSPLKLATQMHTTIPDEKDWIIQPSGGAVDQECTLYNIMSMCKRNHLPSFTLIRKITLEHDTGLIPCRSLTRLHSSCKIYISRCRLRDVLTSVRFQFSIEKYTYLHSYMPTYTTPLRLIERLP